MPVTIGDDYADPDPSIAISWTLIRQSDGTYAFQTSGGDYLTAMEEDFCDQCFSTFPTERTRGGKFEKFTLLRRSREVTG
jgi:hypothetical protein